MSPHARRKVWSAVLIVGFFVLWEAVCWLFNVSDIIVPKPSQVIVTLIQRLDKLLGGVGLFRAQNIFSGRREAGADLFW